MRGINETERDYYIRTGNLEALEAWFPGTPLPAWAEAYENHLIRGPLYYEWWARCTRQGQEQSARYALGV